MAALPPTTDEDADCQGSGSPCIATSVSGTAAIALSPRQHDEVVQCIGSSVLKGAICERAPADTVARLLLEGNRHESSERDAAGMLPLHWAAMCGATAEVVELLVGADDPSCASARDAYGMLPLHLALANGAPPETVEALLQAHPQGAEAKDSIGRLPLHVALSNEAPADVVLKLLNASSSEGPSSAMASTADKDGMLPLHTAAANAAPLEVIEALLEAYAQGTAERDGNGKVPLHWAAARRAPVEVVEALLKANPRAASQKDNSGRLPLHASLSSREVKQARCTALSPPPPPPPPQDNDSGKAHIAASTRRGTALLMRGPVRVTYHLAYSQDLHHCVMCDGSPTHLQDDGSFQQSDK